MEYDKFKDIFNSMIFGRSKAKLIERIAENPHRFIGLFRSTKPKAKLLQNLLHSHEIRFGNAFEAVIEEHLIENGFETLDEVFCYKKDKRNVKLPIDQFFKGDHNLYFVEQKVRDDHDSSSKEGISKSLRKNYRLSLKNMATIIFLDIFILSILT